ncbi:hypothetical protein C3E97_000995 [Pseudomonas sp. MWU12-2115]|nr:hypothetical protein C3E97_000995 [Pseudomonas sp. MWU12-2115]
MGAGLLAKAVAQAMTRAPDTPLSRAGSLLQGIAVYSEGFDKVSEAGDDAVLRCAGQYLRGDFAPGTS